MKIDFVENVTFEGDFAIHQRQHFQTLISNKEIIKKSNSFELYFEHDDLQDMADKIKKFGLEFVHEIVEQPWKQQVFRFYDYDKNLIEVGESMEHVAYRLSQQNHIIDDICKGRLDLKTEFISVFTKRNVIKIKRRKTFNI